jgi:single-stranded DNA-binding protein
MADLNVWVVAGRIASDPETRDVGDQKVTEFRIACDTSRKKDEDSALFMTCVMWGQEGKITWLAKGKKVMGSGPLRQREWVAQDGSKRSVIECVLRDIDPFFANPKGEAQPTPAPKPPVDEDPIPF